MTKEEAARLFGVIPTAPLSEAACERAKEANDLLDALAERAGIREYELFKSVYVFEDDVSRELLHFLHHVSECPKEVLEKAETLLKTEHKKELVTNEYTTKTPHT
ncbi:hypothetical protein IT396_02950 [Candidatus Nomurabacteria bacterium]|nr:hypothetical protein [Candidatus Nomurabacteria bacterium]